VAGLVFPDDVTRWAALRTAARWEKKLADQLAAAGVPVFLPLMTRLTSYPGKRREAVVPVFAGYVFCSEADFLGSKRLTPGVRAKVAQVLRPPDPERLRAELRAIAELLTDRELVQERLAGGVGDAVRIVGGPLTGYTGTVVRAKPHKWALVLEVSFLGARREVEVDERMVERVV
jgi:transcription antitermination factor NusG